MQPAYPNPFNPSITIGYSIPKAARVQLTVYNMLGQQITTLVNTRQDAGSHEVVFDGQNLSSGTYLYRLEAAGNVSINKLTLVK
ncbi:MAG: T9SS type A sorting domain-containing protein [Balneolales bacterium]